MYFITCVLSTRSEHNFIISVKSLIIKLFKENHVIVAFVGLIRVKSIRSKPACNPSYTSYAKVAAFTHISQFELYPPRVGGRRLEQNIFQEDPIYEEQRSHILPMPISKQSKLSAGVYKLQLTSKYFKSIQVDV
jgi:hypothetical protein